MSKILDENIVKKFKTLTKDQKELLNDIQNLSFEERSKLKSIEEQLKIIQTEIEKCLSD